MILEFSSLKELLLFNIKYYRYCANISQEKLAELSGLTPKYLTDVERRKHCPSINKLEVIAKALNIEPYVLFQNPNRDEVIIDKINNSRQYNQSKKNN